MQEIVQLVKEADFWIGESQITIKNHKVIDFHGLLSTIIGITAEHDRNTLSRFEDHGISLEAVIECCVDEVENNPAKLSRIIIWKYGDIYYNDEIMNKTLAFMKSDAGIIFAEQLIEKIRDCKNWADMYDLIQKDSKFHKDMKKTIEKVLKSCRLEHRFQNTGILDRAKSIRWNATERQVS